MTDEQARRAAYGTVADLITAHLGQMLIVDAPSWPVLAELERIQNAMRAAAEMPPSPEGPEDV